ncbi:MAG TPA: hypothetical protein VJ499_11345 [Flavisolibacter sp.]|nr:hypothetical protein [Flavisolibacter sp.]
MKYVYFSIALLCVSCMHYATNKTDLIDSTINNVEASKVQVGTMPEVVEAANKTIWQKIVARPDSVPVEVAINDNLKAAMTISGNLNTSYYEPKTIRVLFSNHTKQDIKIIGTIVLWQKGKLRPYLKMEDVNFDGHADFQVFDNDGAGGNFWYSVWLYDSERKQFVFSKDFSEISSLKPDLRSNLVVGFYHWNGCEENVTYFKVIKYKPAPVKYVFGREERQGDQTLCMGYEKKLIGKTWKTSNLGELGISLYDSLYNQAQ